MAKRDLPGIGLKGNYGIGDDGWGTDQNLNLLKLSALVQGGVKSRLAAVPGAPAQGDVHILTAAPNAQTVAVYDGAAWVYLTPAEGWWFYDRGTNNYITYNGAAWSDFAGGGGGGGGTITESIIIAVGDETTAVAVGTGKVTFRMPYAFTLTAVRASLTTASSSGTPTIDINEGGASILSTKLTIDATEKTSTTAAVPAVISDGALADDAEITIDIDTAGTGAAGLKVYLIGNQ